LNVVDKSSIAELIIVAQIMKSNQKIKKHMQIFIGNGSGFGGSGISSDSSVGILYL